MKIINISSSHISDQGRGKKKKDNSGSGVVVEAIMKVSILVITVAVMSQRH